MKVEKKKTKKCISRDNENIPGGCYTMMFIIVNNQRDPPTQTRKCWMLIADKIRQKTHDINFMHKNELDWHTKRFDAQPFQPNHCEI